MLGRKTVEYMTANHLGVDVVNRIGETGDPTRAARVALNRDDLAGAVTLGEQIGDWWTVGLAQYRQGDRSGDGLWPGVCLG